MVVSSIVTVTEAGLPAVTDDGRLSVSSATVNVSVTGEPSVTGFGETDNEACDGDLGSTAPVLENGGAGTERKAATGACPAVSSRRRRPPAPARDQPENMIAHMPRPSMTGGTASAHSTAEGRAIPRCGKRCRTGKTNAQQAAERGLPRHGQGPRGVGHRHQEVQQHEHEEQAGTPASAGPG